MILTENTRIIRFPPTVQHLTPGPKRTHPQLESPYKFRTLNYYLNKGDPSIAILRTSEIIVQSGNKYQTVSHSLGYEHLLGLQIKLLSID